MTMLRSLFLSLSCLLPVLAAAQASAPAPAECVVPSKPGGAMDLTCKLAKKSLAQEGVAGAAAPMRISYLPGGIGAVAWHSMASQRRRAEARHAQAEGALPALFGHAEAECQRQQQGHDPADGIRVGPGRTHTRRHGFQPELEHVEVGVVEHRQDRRNAGTGAGAHEHGDGQ